MATECSGFDVQGEQANLATAMLRVHSAETPGEDIHVTQGAGGLALHLAKRHNGGRIRLREAVCVEEVNSLRRAAYILISGCSVVLMALGVPAEDAGGVRRTHGSAIKGPVKVFIVAGQSNAEGHNHVREYRGGRVEFPRPYRQQPGILFWRADDARPYQTNAWSTLRIADSGAFGPEIGFACDLAAELPTTRIAIIKWAEGGTGIARSMDYTDYIPSLKDFDDRGNNWHPPSEGTEAGRLYLGLMESVRIALTALDEQHTAWELGGCLWMQGEHEAGISRKMAEDYDQLLADFIRAVRRDLETPSLPFVIGEVNSHTWAYGDTVRKGQAKICRDDRNAVLVKTTDLSRTGSGGAAHFDADGMLVLGSRFAKALISLADGSKDDPIP